MSTGPRTETVVEERDTRAVDDSKTRWSHESEIGHAQGNDKIPKWI